MSSTPHPTIEGVTVRLYGARSRSLQSESADVNVLADVALNDIYVPSGFNPEHTETVIEMIRDQAAWLAAQGATT